MRIGFLCMESVFSVRPLEALVAAGHDVRFVMRPMGPLETRTRDELKRHRGSDVVVRRLLGLTAGGERRDPFEIAHARHIPAWFVGNASSPKAQAFIARQRVDVLVIAFFNQLLNSAVLDIPRLGALNLHPSLLPRYRGPAPLFWTFHDGVDQAGLTLHRVAPGEDDGDVMLQEAVPVPFGTPGEVLIDTLADRAAAMTLAGLEGLARGALVARPQDPRAATRAPRPRGPQLVVDPQRGARQIFHFVRGVGRWNPLQAELGGHGVRVVDAVEIHEGAQVPGEAALVGDLLHLGCDDGVVVLRTRRATLHLR